MTLSGYLPPICDPIDGHLLVDGGYIDSFPINAMKSTMGADRIIGVNIGADFDNKFKNFGDAVSGFRILWNKYNPFAPKDSRRIPNAAEIQERLAFMSDSRAMKNMSKCEHDHFRPPVRPA